MNFYAHMKIALTGLGFLLIPAQNCKNCTFLDNLRTMEAWKLNKWHHFLYLLFPHQLFVTFIFVFENSYNLFSCVLPFSPFQFVKYLNFGQKLPIQTADHTFIESRHSELTTNLYYVFLFSKRSQKRVSAHGLLLRILQLSKNEY